MELGKLSKARNNAKVDFDLQTQKSGSVLTHPGINL